MLDKYKIDGPAVIAFSGGATSGFMLYQIIQAHGGNLPVDIVPVFANTGLEHPKTYDFVQACSDQWGVEVHWVEYAGKKSWKRVNFETASRNGEPFEILIYERQYLPNPITRFCTVEMKIRTMDRYGKDGLGFAEGHLGIIGLRKDEPHRVHRLKANNRRNEAFCPMYWAGHDLESVESFWATQDFRLEIPRNLGNCVGCFLKGRAKIEWIARDFPEQLEWWARAEEKLIGNEKTKSGRFRSDRPSYRGLLKMAASQQEFDFQDNDTLPCHCTE